MQKTAAEVPEYGTIQQRLAADIFEYVDPKGRKPVAYTKVMKKYKITEDQVMEEAGKFNIKINARHFVVPETDGVKRGRPKADKEPKVKGAKGRPKKEKKVIMLEDDDDLFASLVAEANEDADAVLASEDADEELAIPSKKTDKKDSDKKESERLAREIKKAEAEAAKKLKEEQRLKEKAEAEAAKKQKEEQRLKEKAEKEAKLAAEKKLKEEQRLKEKAEKEAKLAAEKAAKEAAKAKSSKKPAQPEEDDEPDVVKKIEFAGKKYLKSKKTGIIYDYEEYVKNGEQEVVGKWNDVTNKIDFSDAEEEEEEYDI
jgi:multidrug efflux pump subunit AcrA (membrane-fusion protein)